MSVSQSDGHNSTGERGGGGGGLERTREVLNHESKDHDIPVV